MKNNRNNSAIQKPQSRVAAAIVDTAIIGELGRTLKIKGGREWLKNATIKDVQKYVKVHGRYGKIGSQDGKVVGARNFYMLLRRSDIYLQATEKEKKIMLGERIQQTKWSRLKKATPEDVKQYIQDQGRYSKGVSWMVSDEGKEEGAQAFYARLSRSPVYKWASYEDKMNMLGKVGKEVVD